MVTSVMAIPNRFGVITCVYGKSAILWQDHFASIVEESKSKSSILVPAISSRVHLSDEQL
jgi:hypothetical protein